MGLNGNVVAALAMVALAGCVNRTPGTVLVPPVSSSLLAFVITRRMVMLLDHHALHLSCISQESFVRCSLQCGPIEAPHG